MGIPAENTFVMASPKLDHFSSEMRSCIENCFEAAQVCEWCADECLEMGDEEMTRCIQLCRDVADLTTLHARLMARTSGYHRELAAVCADACEDCLKECRQFDADHCQACVDVLEDCAESCRQMARA